MDTRNLPGFDNHYGNATLVENWREDRLYHEQVDGGSGEKKQHLFTLSGASPQQQARDITEWNATVSTYTDAYGHGAQHGGEGLAERGQAADMCRPQELQRELLLGTGSAAEHDATSSEYGAFWRGPDEVSAGQTSRKAIDGQRGPEEACRDLLGSTAAARQQAHVRNLYESNHLQASRRGGPLTFTGAGCPALFKTLDDTVGRVQTIDQETNRPADLDSDDAVADRFATTKTCADVPVSQFYFQRKMPPPTR